MRVNEIPVLRAAATPSLSCGNGCGHARLLLRMRSTKVVGACIFNKLQATGLFLALDGTSTRIDPSTSGRKYRKSVNNAVFIRNESLFIVSAATECIPIKAHAVVATQHMPCHEVNGPPKYVVPPDNLLRSKWTPCEVNGPPLRDSVTCILPDFRPRKRRKSVIKWLRRFHWCQI